MLITCVLTVLTVGRSAFAYPQHKASFAGPIDSRARSIVQLMESTYGGIRSYADTGFSSTVFARGGEITGHRETSFRTRLARPASIRFEISTPQHDGKVGFALWGDGKQRIVDKTKVFVANEFDGRDQSIQREVPLDVGIAGLTGISEGVAHVVPRMFFPRIGGRTFSDLKDLRLVREDKLALGDCQVLKSASEGTTIWIEKSHHALLKMVVMEDLGALGHSRAHVLSTQTIAYRPEFNPSLNTKDFWFTPPGSPMHTGS